MDPSCVIGLPSPCSARKQAVDPPGEAFPGKEHMPKISSLRGRMLLLILPAVVVAIAVLTVLSISRATKHETDAVNDSLRNRSGQEASNVNTEVERQLAIARSAAVVVDATPRPYVVDQLSAQLK